MSERPREDDEVEDLLSDLRYLWESQGPAGRNRGQRALQELLWRWEFLPFDYWEQLGTERAQIHEGMDNEVALMSIAVEAERRGYEDELVLLDKSFE